MPRMREAPNRYLKVHLHDGRLLVCEIWQIHPETRSILCGGLRFDAQRNPRGTESGTTSFDEIALVEIARPTSGGGDPGYPMLGVLSGVSALVSSICLVVTDACFPN
jgi:hypothetical protein